MRFALGISMLMVVVTIWVASAELTEYLFSDNSFSKPYFITYLCASSFSVFLLAFPFRPEWKTGLLAYMRELRQRQRNGSCFVCGSSRRQGSARAGFIGSVNVAGAEAADEGEDEYEERPRKEEHRPLLRGEALSSKTSPVSAGAVTALSPAAATAASAPAMLSFGETFEMCLSFFILWFIANYIYTLSLDYTSVSSNTILSATSSFFTLVFGAIFPGTSDDHFTLFKLMCVLLSIGGVVLVSLSDSSTGGDTSWGDIETVISAMMYGVYLSFLRRRTGQRDVDMMLLLGLVGLLTLLCLWPGFFIFHYTGIEPFEWPPGRTWLYLLCIAFIGTVLSEILWLRATLLTTPVIATVVVSASIPIAIVADVIFRVREPDFTWQYWVGTVLLVVAFVLLALVTHNPKAPEQWMSALLACCRPHSAHGSVAL